jgi:hypothetical protein
MRTLVRDRRCVDDSTLHMGPAQIHFGDFALLRGILRGPAHGRERGDQCQR